MAHFLRHEPCPNCGSKDNLARYSDGSAHCFGCKYNERGDISYVVQESARERQSSTMALEPLTSDFPPECVGWLLKYHIDVPTALLHGLKWNPSRQQLVFSWFDGKGELIAWQARNFARGSKSKYFTQGDIEALMPIYHNAPGCKTIVLVEDVISAIRVSEFVDAMPCLSSGLSTNKLARLSRMYKNIGIWLDSNMLSNAQKMGNSLELLGCMTNIVHTPLDPKEYDKYILEKTIKHLTN